MSVPTFMTSKWYDTATGKLDPKAPKSMREEFVNYQKLMRFGNRKQSDRAKVKSE